MGCGLSTGAPHPPHAHQIRRFLRAVRVRDPGHEPQVIERARAPLCERDRPPEHKPVRSGGARVAEEAAALAAVVTVPMRVSGSEGWAAAKTAAFGGRVIGSRSRLSLEQLEVLWRPIQPAIPLAFVVAVTKSRR